MVNELEPVVGQWYWHHDKGQPFVVVSVNGDAAVEIQHFDGDVEEVDLEAWREMDIELGEPPEDWTGPADDLETDDLDYTDAGMDRQSWEQSGGEYRRRPETWSNEPDAREQADTDSGEEEE
ncbi:MAG: hypothetical protein PVH31_01865 [Ectothiorhodospiraceae bacterium]